MKSTILRERYKVREMLALLTSIMLALISILIANNGDVGVSIIISICGFIAMFFGILSCLRNYATLTITFLVFMFLYTYAGVATVVWGSGLHPIFNQMYRPNIFIIYSNIAYMALYLGFYVNYKPIKIQKVTSQKMMEINFNKPLINRAILTSLIALAMELVNIVRVGGLSTVSLGKAYYGSQISELNLTLPSEMFLIVSGIYFSLYLSDHVYREFKMAKIRIFVYILSSTTLLLIYSILGMRGVLLSYLMILLTGYLHNKKENKISIKLIIAVLLIYVFLAVVYSSRASIGFYLLENRDLQGFVDTVFRKEIIIEALFPNEFTVAFGNFNQYIVSASNHTLKLGSTYLKGVLAIIPGFLYPGTKPLQIIYEFRNFYFPAEAARGSIAGTGFSILLESYMNFGVIGIILNYFIIGFILAKLEKLRSGNKNNLWISSIYLSCFYFVAHFQRSSFSDILSNIFMLSVIILVTAIDVLQIKTRKF